MLRPEDVFFTVRKGRKVEFCFRRAGKGIPDVQRHTLLYPFTVFNAAQIENFPAREQPAPVMSEAQRKRVAGTLCRQFGCGGRARQGRSALRP